MRLLNRAAEFLDLATTNGRRSVYACLVAGLPASLGSSTPIHAFRTLRYTAVIKPAGGQFLLVQLGHSLDLDAWYQREMKDVLKRAGIIWHNPQGTVQELKESLTL